MNNWDLEKIAAARKSEIEQYVKQGGGLLVIGALYMLVNAAVQYALPAFLVAQSSSPMSDAVQASVLGTAAAVVVSAAMVISLTTSLNGVAMSGSRMAFALARDGNFFTDLAKVHPRYRTPHVAITAQAILSICFLMIGGNFRQLFTLALFAEWLSYVAASSSLFVFRRKMSQPERRPSVWEYCPPHLPPARAAPKARADRDGRR